MLLRPLFHALTRQKKHITGASAIADLALVGPEVSEFIRTEKFRKETLASIHT
jgi:hypothetical protein